MASADHRVIASSDGEIPARVTRGSQPGPALVVIPSIFGVERALSEQLERLTAGGGVAWAFDPFWRTTPGVLDASIPGQLDAALSRANEVTRAQVAADLNAVANVALGDPACNGKLAVLGICFGGSHAFVAGSQSWVHGVVAWHGTRIGQCLELAPKIDAMLCLHFGAQDALVPPDEVERIREAFKGRDKAEIVVHPEAQHGFTLAHSPSYEPQACEAALRGTETVLAALRT